MMRDLKKKSFYINSFILFIALYGCIAYLFVIRTNNKDIEQIHAHGAIISDDVWNLNRDGIEAYLMLALQADHFKNFTITLEKNELFVQVVNTHIDTIDSFLERIDLIWTKDMAAVITFENEELGILKGKKLVRVFYPLVNIFVFQFFLSLTGLFILYLFHNRRFLEQQVRERTKRYHELVNLLPEMVLETDADGQILFANEIALSNFGMNQNNLSEYHCSDLINLGENEINFWTFHRVKEPEQIEITAKKMDGTNFPVLIRSAPIYSNDNITGARVVIVDITERTRLEEQLNRDQKMKSIGMMAGGVAHDLNNILSGVVNYPELMLMHIPENSPLRNYVQPMKEAGLRAAAIVADLLTVARGVAAARVLADVNSLIIDYLESPEFRRLLTTYPQLRYRTRFDSAPGLISCSEIHVRKCLMNLITNAAESMAGDGEIAISTTTTEVSPNLSDKLNVPIGHYVIVSIQDQGPGIAPRDRNRIFEPFYTTKEMGRSGTGLGLTVVWNTMEDHNGTVAIETSKQGTTFILYFPFVEAKVPVIEKTENIKFYEGNGERILVVDDEHQQRDIATQLLTSFGYKVDAVASGEEALEYVTKNHADLLLLDMVIGTGMSGLQTYKKILEIHPNQRAVIASGFSESEDVKATLRLGAGSLINKPYTKEQLAKEAYKELHR